MNRQTSGTAPAARRYARHIAPVELVCAHCGGPVKSFSGRVRFCGVRCRVASHRARHKVAAGAGAGGQHAVR